MLLSVKQSCFPFQWAFPGKMWGCFSFTVSIEETHHRLNVFHSATSRLGKGTDMI